MTGEEINRKFEIVANLLASTAVKVDAITDKVNALADAQARTDAGLARLTEQVAQIAVQQAHMNEVVAVIADAQQHTDERLNALIGVVERHITETHGGAAAE